MLNLSCHCGQVRVHLSKRPDFINECNCTLCSKAGARWAYLHPSEVSVEGPAQGYRRDDKDDPAAEVHFCASCGSTTHFTLTESAAARFGNTLVGVNMRLADERDLAGLELRYPDGRAWSGEGAFGFVREPRILGEDKTPASAVEPAAPGDTLRHANASARPAHRLHSHREAEDRSAGRGVSSD